MNKLLLVLSCICFTSLSAASEKKPPVKKVEKKEQVSKIEKKEETKVEEECHHECPPPKPCPPRCCPTPKPAVCCECYVPSYYDLQCNQGAFLYGDFLFWYSNESNLSPCMTVQGNSTAIPSAVATTENIVLNLVQTNYLHAKWDPGFRVALGYNFERDGWDLEANYTWYHNRKAHTFSVPGFGTNLTGTVAGIFPFFPNNGQLAFLDPWINTTIAVPGDTSFLFDKVFSTWKLNFNQIDLELGRKFWLSHFMATRAYAGVRGAWFNTKFNNAASSHTSSVSFSSNTFIDYFKDRMWGVGLLGGIQPEWHLHRFVILFSNLDAALLYGKFRVHKKEDYTSIAATGLQTINYHNNSHSSFNHMQAVLDLALGLRWEETWCGKTRTSVDVAWENHIWFDANHRTKVSNNKSLSAIGDSTLNVATLQSYEEVAGNLMMGGLVIRFRGEF